MKIFDQQDPWDTKVNFVDENNVVLGYDMSSQCCEDYGWFISNRVVSTFSEYGQLNETFDHDDYTDWRFDPTFFVENCKDSGDYLVGGIAVFRIVHKDTQESRYIHLYNLHNGYYSHGFSFTESGTCITGGHL